MRAAIVLLSIGLAGCAANDLAGELATGLALPQISAMEPAPAPQAQAPQVPEPQVSAPRASAMAPVAVSPPVAAPPPAEEPKPAPAAARRAAPPPPPEPAPAPEPQEPMTHERASAICWMKYEDGRRKLTLDQRADLVDQCVKATLAGHPPK